MAVPKKKQSKTRSAKRAANWKARPRRTRNARSATSPSCRTGCAATAATTPAVRPSRSSSGVSSAPVEASLESLDRALGVPFHDAALREAALTHRSYAFEHGTEVDERAPGVPGRLGARARRHGHGVRGVPGSARRRAGQAPRRDRQHGGARRRRPVARTGRHGAPGQGRGALAVGATSRASWPTRWRRSSAPSTSTAALRGLTRADRTAVPPAHGGLRPRRGRPRLQDDPAGARLAGAPLDAGVPAGANGVRTTQKEFTATVFLAGEALGSGTGRSKKEAEQQAAREAYARISERLDGERAREGDEVELPEVEVMRRDLEKDVVGRRIKEAEVKPLEERDARHPPPPETQGVHLAPGRTQDHEGRAARQVPRDAARLRRRARHALRDERAVPARDRARGACRPTPTSS